jgi:predicted O-methyltransferase YrrM
VRTFVHFCKCLAGLDEAATQVTQAELAMLLKHSRGAEILVELGCYEGATAVALARNAPGGQVHSIDPFYRGRIGLSYGYWIARLEIWRKRVRNIHLIRAFSYDAIKQFQSQIDFLFIDADHSREGVERDWSDWLPKLRTGGLIAMHDCRISSNSPIELGTMQFYRERLSKLDDIVELDAVDSLAIFQKRQLPR